MHTHNVAVAAWRWRHESAPVEAMLRRIAAEELILVSSGGSGWLAGSGRAERVEGGYRVTARMAIQHMIDTASRETPGPATTSTVVVGRTLVGRAAIRTVEKAMEVAGGRAFYRSFPIERLFRDVQGARYHPLQEKAQLRYTGRLALGMDIDG